MLPLVGEKLSQGNQQASTLFMASSIVVAQIVMISMAMLVGRKADDWGRKRILVGFAVLPIRGILYALTENPYALVATKAMPETAKPPPSTAVAGA
jgi:MFS family permease